MPGQSTSQQSTTQASQTAPWAAAQPLLGSIIGDLSGLNTNVTPGQTSAYTQLTNAASGLPNFAPQAEGVVNNAFGTNTTPQQNLLTGANTTFQDTLSPYLSSSYLNPMNTPGLSTELQGLTNTISNNVNDQFAAAGRSLSPGNSTALAYGLEQGEAPVLASQYNANVANQLAAGNAGFGASNTTAQGLTAQQLAQLQAETTGLSAASTIPGLATQPGMTAEQIATMQAQQPFTNLGWLSSLAYPLGALGSQSSGSGTQTGTATQPWSQTLGQLGAGLGGLSMFMFSDENVKEDVTPIGMLYDGQPIYSYKYIPEIDPAQTPRIGVLAQDVEKTQPDAVVKIDGVRAVDYGKVADRARFYGMLSDLDLAA